MSPIKTLLLSTMVVCGISAEQQKDPLADLSQSQKEILKKYEFELEKAKIEYYQKLNALRTNTYALYNAQIEEITKSGNAEKALTFKKIGFDYINALNWWTPPTVRNNRNVIIYSPDVDKDKQTVNIMINNNPNTTGANNVNNTENNTSTLPETYTGPFKIQSVKILPPKDVVGETSTKPDGKPDLILEIELLFPTTSPYTVDSFEVCYKKTPKDSKKWVTTSRADPQNKLYIIQNNKILNPNKDSPMSTFVKPEKLLMVSPTFSNFSPACLMACNFRCVNREGILYMALFDTIDINPLLPQ